MAVDFQEPPVSLCYVNLALGGVAIETAHPAAGMRGVRLAYDRTGDVVYARVGTGAGGRTPAWVSLNGGADLNLGKYWVAPPGNVPSAPYTTIQSAIAAAVADGHGQENPAIVFVWPADYAENISLVAGIRVVCPGQEPPYAAVSGAAVNNVTVALAEAGEAVLSGFAVAGTTTVGGAVAHVVTFDRCFFAQTVAITAAGGAAHDVNFVQSVVLTGAGPGVTFGGTTAAGGLSFYQSLVVGATHGVQATAANVAVRANDCRNLQGATSAVTVTGSDSVFLPLYSLCNGPVVATGGALVRGEYSDVYTTVGSPLTIADVPGHVHHWRHGVLDAAASPCVAGASGSIELTQNVYVQGTRDLHAATVTIVPRLTDALRATVQSYSGAGPHALTAGVQVARVDTGNVAGIVVNLPSVLVVGVGEPVTVVNENAGAAGTIVVTPAGGQTINGAPTLTLAAAAGGYQAVTLRAIPPTGWLRVGN